MQIPTRTQARRVCQRSSALNDCCYSPTASFIRLNWNPSSCLGWDPASAAARHTDFNSSLPRLQPWASCNTGHGVFLLESSFHSKLSAVKMFGCCGSLSGLCYVWGFLVDVWGFLVDQISDIPVSIYGWVSFFTNEIRPLYLSCFL